MTLAYLRDPAAIYRASFATIRAEAGLDALPEAIRPLALRVVHACGMTDVARALRFSADAADCGRHALEAGAPVLCDARMVADGVQRLRLPRANAVIATTESESAAARAKREGTTRAAAGIGAFRESLAGAVVAIGNAPTALFRLLEEIDAGAPRPALILAFPVGFVGAEEAKAELLRDPRGVAYVTLPGRRGGSAMAAAAVNALLGNAEDDAP